MKRSVSIDFSHFVHLAGGVSPAEEILNALLTRAVHRMEQPGKYSVTNSTVSTAHSRPLSSARHPASVVNRKASL